MTHEPIVIVRCALTALNPGTVGQTLVEGVTGKDVYKMERRREHAPHASHVKMVTFATDVGIRIQIVQGSVKNAKIIFHLGNALMTSKTLPVSTSMYMAIHVPASIGLKVIVSIVHRARQDTYAMETLAPVI